MARQPEEVRRAGLVSAATRVFGRLGFRTATMDDVAREARVSKGLAFFHFKTKQALLEAVVRSFIERDLAELRRLRVESGTVVERLSRFAAREANQAGWFGRVAALLFDVYAAACRDARLRSLCADYYHRQREEMAALLRSGAAEGEFALDDPVVAADALMTLHDGAFVRWSIDRDVAARRREAEFAIRRILRLD